MMRSFLADLDLVSSTLSLAQVSALVGHAPGSASHDLGEPRTKGPPWDQTIWRLSSTAGGEASLEEHLSALRDHAKELGLLSRDDLPGDFQRVLSIAVMHDTFTCTVHLPAALLLPFLAAGFDLEISAYPVGQGPAPSDSEPDAAEEDRDRDRQ